MIPVIKGWCTENSVDIASLGIQVHGGVGFVEETGAAQYLRDARITPIYEGTTGIQANDLIGRKLARDGGQSGAGRHRGNAGAGGDACGADRNWRGLLPAFSASRRCAGTRDPLRGGELRHGYPRRVGGRRAHAQIVRHRGGRLAAAAFGVDRAAAPGRSSSGGDAAFYEAKISTARFYADTCCRRRRDWRTASCTARPARWPRVCFRQRHGQPISAAASFA